MGESFRQQMDRFLDEYVRREHFSGTVRVTVKDEIVYQRHLGMADFEQGIGLDDDSVFTLYSITKAFCAIGFMKLVDRGLVELDRHPGAYLPEAAGFDARLTLRHLLQHTGGMPDFLQDTDLPGRCPGETSAQLRSYLPELSTYPLHFAPGTGAKYSNINYTIPALIIEEVTGRPFAEYMQAEAFAPLGAHTAQIADRHTRAARRVKGYDWREGERVCVGHVDEWYFGAGDMIGRVDDVYTLNHALKHRLLLSPAGWDALLTPSEHNKKGFGCTITDWHGKYRVTHNGGSRGFRTLHIHLPEDDFDVILLSNSGWGDSRAHIPEAIYRAWYGTDGRVQEHIEMDTGYI